MCHSKIFRLYLVDNKLLKKMDVSCHSLGFWPASLRKYYPQNGYYREKALLLVYVYVPKSSLHVLQKMYARQVKKLIESFSFHTLLVLGPICEPQSGMIECCCMFLWPTETSRIYTAFWLFFRLNIDLALLDLILFFSFFIFCGNLWISGWCDMMVHLFCL